MVLLPEEAEMTLAELRQVAARQQHQIEAQQQLLVAKEQRLKFLKQQEARHHGLSEQQIDTICLQKLREKVEAQEMKLRHLRSLRGQVEQQKTHNGNLGIELESIRALFNEKEKELSLAVTKVEELTRQLDEIRNGNKRKNCINSTLNSELEKLRRELLYRTKLAEQQNNLASEQRGLIAQRQQDISHLDKKIGELTQRLHRKRLVNQQLASQIHSASLSKHSLPTPNRVCVHPMVNIAAVEPIQRESQELEQTQDDLAAKLRLTHQGDLSEFCQSKNDPKYQTLPYNTKFTLKGRQYLDDSCLLPESETLAGSSSSAPFPPQAPVSSNKISHNMCNFAPRPFVTTSSSLVTRIVPHQPPFFLKETNSSSNLDLPESCVKKECENQNSNNNKESENLTEAEVLDKEEEEGNSLHTITLDDDGDPKPKSEILPSATCNARSTKPVVPPKPTFPLKPVPPPRQMSLSAATKENDDDDDCDISLALSVLQNTSEKDTSNYRERLLYYHCVPRYSTHNTTRKESSSGAPKLMTYFPKPLVNIPDQNPNSITKPMEYCDLPDGPKRKPSPIHFPIKPKPLTIRKTPGLEPPKLKVQQVVNTGGHRKTSEQNISAVKPNAVIIKPVQKEPCDVSLLPVEDIPVIEESPTCKDEVQTAESNVLADNTTIPPSTEHEKKESCLDAWEMEQKESHCDDDDAWNLDEPDSLEDKSDSTNESTECLPINGLAEDERKEVEELTYQSAALRRVKKGNLKTEGSVRSPRRVSFDPLALLLDAALEGELELVKKTANEVPNASAANDEGITALHNAICAGHFEIVTFLVEFGCDVNAQDSDGWTPLHCAASCNNLPMVKFLVERGACIFATTLSDQETAAEKCEEDEEGFVGCSEYLYSLQENLGVMNDGMVYAVYDYESQNSDELSFKDSDLLTVLRKGDDLENEWWWSRLIDREGYIPRNLLGLYPRITARNE